MVHIIISWMQRVHAACPVCLSSPPSHSLPLACTVWSVSWCISQIRKYIQNQKFITAVLTFQIVTRFVWIIRVGGGSGGCVQRVRHIYFFFSCRLPLSWITLVGHFTKMWSLAVQTSHDLPHYIIGKTNPNDLMCDLFVCIQLNSVQSTKWRRPMQCEKSNTAKIRFSLFMRRMDVSQSDFWKTIFHKYMFSPLFSSAKWNTSIPNIGHWSASIPRATILKSSARFGIPKEINATHCHHHHHKQYTRRAFIEWTQQLWLPGL